MTYKEKLQELNDTVKVRIQAYRELTVEMKSLVIDGYPVTLAQLNEQQVLFVSYQKALTAYNELTRYLLKNKISFTAAASE